MRSPSRDHSPQERKYEENSTAMKNEIIRLRGESNPFKNIAPPSQGGSMPFAINLQSELPRPAAVTAQAHKPSNDGLGAPRNKSPHGDGPSAEDLTSRRSLPSAANYTQGVDEANMAGSRTVAVQAGSSMSDLCHGTRGEGFLGKRGRSGPSRPGLCQLPSFQVFQKNIPSHAEATRSVTKGSLNGRLGVSGLPSTRVMPNLVNGSSGDVGDGRGSGSFGGSASSGIADGGDGAGCSGAGVDPGRGVGDRPGGAGLGNGGSSCGGMSALIAAIQIASVPPQGQLSIQPTRQESTPTRKTAPAVQRRQKRDYKVSTSRDFPGGPIDAKISLQHTFTHDSFVCCVRYSWNGEFLATGSKNAAEIFDAQTGKRVSILKQYDGDVDPDDGIDSGMYVRAVCFSPDGKWLITGAEDQTVKVWDVRNRKIKYNLLGHEADIYSVDVSANGQFIISGSGDQTAKLWSAEAGKLLSTLGFEFSPENGITSVSVSPTNRHVATGSLDKMVRVWDVETSQVVEQFEGHSDYVYSVAFSPDGRSLVSGSLDKTLKLWDGASSSPSRQSPLCFTGHKDFVLCVGFNPNGHCILSGSRDRTARLWDTRKPSEWISLEGHYNSVISLAHNPRTKSFATGSGDLRARTWSILL